MLSIDVAGFAHKHATYDIPAGARREFGSEAIIRELEIETAARRKAMMNKLSKLSLRLRRCLIGSTGRVTNTQTGALTRRSASATDERDKDLAQAFFKEA